MQTRAQARVDVAPQIAGQAPTVTVVTSDGKTQVLHIPTNHDEMMALMAQREALTDQLDNANDRQHDVMEALRSAPPEAKPGLQVQMTALTDQIVGLQNDLGRINREISQASPALIAMTHEDPDPNPDEPGSFKDGLFLGGAGVFTAMIVLLAFGSVIFRRFMRGSVGGPRALPAADSQRLQRLEQGMEAIAIEVERISEGQRYVTKLMSEQRSAESTPR